MSPLHVLKGTAARSYEGAAPVGTIGCGAHLAPLCIRDGARLACVEAGLAALVKGVSAPAVPSLISWAHHRLSSSGIP